MRLKLIAGNIAVALLITVLTWWMVRANATESLGSDVRPAVDRGPGLCEAIRATAGYQYTEAVQNRVRRSDMTDLFGLPTTAAQTQQAQPLVNTIAQEFAQLPPWGRAADIVAIVNREGISLARNSASLTPLDINRNVKNEFEVVATALGTGNNTGRISRDFLQYDNQKWYDVVVAPVVVDNQVKGVLIVGFEIADSLAQSDARQMGLDVGYVVLENNDFTFPSLSFGTQTQKEALRRWANGQRAVLAAFNRPGASIPTNTIDIDGTTWAISATAIPGLIIPSRDGAVRPGCVVLKSISAAQSPSGGVALPVLLFGLGGVILLVLYNLYIAGYLLKPIEQIEEGLLRIINGDRDHRIELQHAELGGVVYRINQVISELTGAEEETDESGRIERQAPRPSPAQPAAQGPEVDELSIGTFNPGGNPQDAQLLERLQSEPENEYYDRLRREYNQARQRAGQGPDGMSHEDFVSMVSASEQSLAQKYSLTLVRFTVVQQGNSVVFRAVPIR